MNKKGYGRCWVYGAIIIFLLIVMIKIQMSKIFAFGIGGIMVLLMLAIYFD